MARTRRTTEIAPPWSGDDPSPAGELATERGRLDLHGLALIGVFGGEDDRRALMRRADGRILSLHTGDTTPEGRVAAIGKSSVILARGARTRALSMPD